jgi:hypothetical protein
VSRFLEGNSDRRDLIDISEDMIPGNIIVCSLVPKLRKVPFRPNLKTQKVEYRAKNQTDSIVMWNAEV